MWLKDTSFSTMSLTDNLFVTSRKGFHKDEGRLLTQTLQEMTHLPWLLPAALFLLCWQERILILIPMFAEPLQCASYHDEQFFMNHFA